MNVILINETNSNTTTNVTNLKYSTHAEWNNLLVGVVLIAISLTTICGNLLVICAVKRERILKTSTNYYIISLAVADLLVGLVVMPFNSLNEMTDNFWFFGEVWCDVWHSLDVFASTASILSLLMIALDRHAAISDPIKYPTRWLNCNWFLFVAGIWICSAFISFPAIAYWRWITTEYIPNKCVFTDDVYYLVFSSLVSFYVPLTLMIIVYIRIYRAATKQVNAIRTGQKLNVKGSDGQALTLRIHRGGYRGINAEKKTPVVKSNVPISNTTISNRSFLLKKSSSFTGFAHLKPKLLTSSHLTKSLPNFKRLNRIEIIKESNPNTTSSNNNKASTNHLAMLIMNSSPRFLNNPHSYSVANSAYSLNTKASSFKLANQNYEEYKQTIDFYESHYAEHQTQLANSVSSKSIKASHKQRKCSSCKQKRLNENCCVELKRILMTKINSLSLTRKMSKFSREQKAAKTLGIVMGVFIICWMPFFLYQTLAIGIFNKPTDIKQHTLIYTVFTWFGYINSGCNPIIYAFSSREFRRAFYKILFSSRLAQAILSLFGVSNTSKSQLKRTATQSTSTQISLPQCQVCHLYKQIILANTMTNLNRKTLLMLINEKNRYLETNINNNNNKSIIAKTTTNTNSKVSESFQELNKKSKNDSLSLTQSLQRRFRSMFNSSNTNPVIIISSNNNSNISNSSRRTKQSIQLKRTPSIDSVSSGVSLVLIKSKPSQSSFSKEYQFDRQKSKLILLNNNECRIVDDSTTRSSSQRIPVGTKFSFVKSNENSLNAISTSSSSSIQPKRQVKQVYSFRQNSIVSNSYTKPSVAYLLSEQTSVNSKSQYCSFDDETYTDRIFND